LVVLQNLPDTDKLPGLCNEICPASCCGDAYQAVSIKAEVFSDGDEEEHPVLPSDPEMKTETEVNFVSVRWISQIQVSLV
jgi:hypothetical protein